jgi:hypothetical protein
LISVKRVGLQEVPSLRFKGIECLTFIHSSNSDSRSVTLDFDPDITMDYKRQLIGTFPMTADGQAAIPKRLRVGSPRRGGVPHILGWSMGAMDRVATYFLILPPPKVDAIIRDLTEFDSSLLLKPRGRCILDADAIRGRHFWRDHCSTILLGRAGRPPQGREAGRLGPSPSMRGAAAVILHAGPSPLATIRIRDIMEYISMAKKGPGNRAKSRLSRQISELAWVVVPARPRVAVAPNGLCKI